MIPLVHTAEIGDTLIFAIDQGDLVLLVLALALGFVGVAWLANRAMPVPAREAWHQETERRRWAASERHWARVRAGKRRR